MSSGHLDPVHLQDLRRPGQQPVLSARPPGTMREMRRRAPSPAPAGPHARSCRRECRSPAASGSHAGTASRGGASRGRCHVDDGGHRAEVVRQADVQVCARGGRLRRASERRLDSEPAEAAVLSLFWKSTERTVRAQIRGQWESTSQAALNTQSVK